MKPYKRSNYFIDRRFQTKYIFLTLMLLITYTITLIAMIFVPYVIDLGGDGAQQAAAARTFVDLHSRIWPGVIAAILLFCILSVYISHQVAGPVYRIKKGIGKILEGDLTSPIHLRRRDDLKDLAECTNLLRNELLALYTVLRDHQDLLIAYRHDLEKNGGDDTQIARVQAEIARNQETIDKYRTE